MAATGSHVTGVFPSSSLDHQLSGFLELFIDIMYGDVVLNDRCCRRLGDDLVGQQEATLRALLVAAAEVLPDGLRKAISTYCGRSLLLRSPELMLTSSQVRQGLLQLADHLGDGAAGAEGVDAPMASVGNTIREEVLLLSKKLETKRYAHLIDTLGDAVIGYMSAGANEMRLAADKELEDETKLLPSPFIQKFLPTVARFAAAANQERQDRKRRREADLDRRADTLLFSRAQGAEQETTTAPLVDGNAQKSPTHAESFADEVREAMSTPVSHLGNVKLLRVPPPSTTRKTESAQHPHLHIDDSVEAGVAALEAPVDSAAPEGSTSEILVELSEDVPKTTGKRQKRPGRPAAAPPVTIAASDASVLIMMGSAGLEPQSSPESGSADASGASAKATSEAKAYVLESKETVARSYFLCAATNRYEPVVAKGFYVSKQ